MTGRIMSMVGAFAMRMMPVSVLAGRGVNSFTAGLTCGGCAGYGAVLVMRNGG
jgi:hypothetical protein